MSARINHVAITSDHYATNARFYEALFGMKTGKKPLPPARAISIGDGYVGMTHIPRRDGRTSGLDHFGIEVDDIEDTIARMQKFDSEALKRPPIRPYAAYSAHDPDTNIFDLSQRNIGFQKDVYADNSADDRAAAAYAEPYRASDAQRGAVRALLCRSVRAAAAATGATTTTTCRTGA